MSRKNTKSLSPLVSTTQNPQLPSCKTCRFWYDIGEGVGNCRRFPPTIIPPLQAMSLAPLMRGVTSKDDWCGEFTPTSPTSIPPQVKPSNE